MLFAAWRAGGCLAEPALWCKARGSVLARSRVRWLLGRWEVSTGVLCPKWLCPVPQPPPEHLEAHHQCGRGAGYDQCTSRETRVGALNEFKPDHLLAPCNDRSTYSCLSLGVASTIFTREPAANPQVCVLLLGVVPCRGKRSRLAWEPEGKRQLFQSDCCTNCPTVAVYSYCSA